MHVYDTVLRYSRLVLHGDIHCANSSFVLPRFFVPNSQRTLAHELSYACLTSFPETPPLPVLLQC